MRPELHPFRLVCQLQGSDARLDREVEARDLDGAYAKAGRMIADHMQLPDAYVAFDRDAGHVTVGAGYRSWRGDFRLEPLTVRKETDAR